MIDVLLPSRSWPAKKLEAIYRCIQHASAELGFIYQSSLADMVKENEFRGSLWAAYRAEELLGAAMVGSRVAYAHIWRHGDINVLSQFRRQRVGTSLYVAQICQAILEGRREVEDTIVPSLSPGMRGETECGMGFLLSFNYKLYGRLPERTRAFKDIELWGKSVCEFDDWLCRLPSEGTNINLVDTPKMRTAFEKNLHPYKTHRQELAHIIMGLRERVLNTMNVRIISDEAHERDHGGNWRIVKAVLGKK